VTAADGDAAPAVRAALAVPGDPETPTGGYVYARELLHHARSAGLILDPWPLPGGFPDADAGTLAETERRLMLLPAGWPVIVDGLALGVLPPALIAATGGPVIALCHHPLGLETGLEPDRSRALIDAERAALAACAGVVTTSRTTAATLIRDFAVPAGRITVAPPGTVPAPRAAGSPGPGVHILSVGSLTPRKGHDVLIAALASIRDLDWRLPIVGPADRDPGCAAALVEAIAAHGLADRVRLAGAADAPALARHYDAADLFVLASRYEGFGMALAEAMAHGLPVVGCDAGAVAEATLGAARLVPPDDSAALAGALAPLIAEPLTRARLRADCARAAEALPRWADTAAAMAEAVARAMQPAR